MLLEHVPTPPVSDTYPPFIFAEMSLREWLEYDDNGEGAEDLHLSERAQMAMNWGLCFTKSTLALMDYLPKRSIR